MSHPARLFWGLVLVSLLAGPLLAQGPPVPLGPGPVVPSWTPVPGVAGVEYAPNLQMDLFRHQGQYYYYQQGYWYQGQNPSGPWKHIKKVPVQFYQVDAAYFRSPPGWAKGRKTGWKGAPLPPGQMKKWGGAP